MSRAEGGGRWSGVGGGSVRYSKLLHPPPLSSRGLGRRPLTAVTRVRIPVAVLRKSPEIRGFFVARGQRPAL
jgi:hypothetical protein